VSYSRSRGWAFANVTAAVGASSEGVSGSNHSEESSEDGEALHFDDVLSHLVMKRVDEKLLV
jgi:hypothetical protein